MCSGLHGAERTRITFGSISAISIIQVREHLGKIAVPVNAILYVGEEVGCNLLIASGHLSTHGTTRHGTHASHLLNRVRNINLATGCAIQRVTNAGGIAELTQLDNQVSKSRTDLGNVFDGTIVHFDRANHRENFIGYAGRTLRSELLTHLLDFAQYAGRQLIPVFGSILVQRVGAIASDIFPFKGDAR